MQKIVTVDVFKHVLNSHLNYDYSWLGTIISYQNSYAYVNAGFYVTFDKEKLSFQGKPRIIFGGLGLEMVSCLQYVPAYDLKLSKTKIFHLRKYVLSFIKYYWFGQGFVI